MNAIKTTSTDAPHTAEHGDVIAGHRHIVLLPDNGNAPKRRHDSFVVEGRAILDRMEIQTKNGIEVIIIRAIPFTCYWAILCCMYHKHDKRVTEDELCCDVEHLMREKALQKWEKFRNKKAVTARLKENQGHTTMQSPKDWKTRLITNARNLCRTRVFGKRLIEAGHVMRYATGSDGKGYFSLFLKATPANITKYTRGRKRKLFSK